MHSSPHTHAHTHAEDLWPEADPETCERRGWRGRHRLLTGLVAGALLAAFMDSEALAQAPVQPHTAASHESSP